MSYQQSVFGAANGGKFLSRVAAVPWVLVLCVFALAVVGFAALYSAAGGNLEPWAFKQMVRFLPGFVGLIIIALVDIKWVYRLAYPFWFLCVVLLVYVDIAGVTGMGAQRWISLGVMNLQPSDVSKVAVVLAIARYYHGMEMAQVKRLRTLIGPMFITLVPVVLVVMQPDLGTALMIVLIGVAMVFLAGAPWWLFAGGGLGVAAAIPTIYHYALHDYQRERVMTFLNPERDPLGAGYHITQSKIAIGSGGLEGKGYLQGSQSHLNFLPEKHTDFIFTMIAEEWGFIGVLSLLTLFSFVFIMGFRIAFRARHSFGRLLALGLVTNYSIYIVINVGMVAGLMPVVGEPLPLISYGGTAMMSSLLAFGLMACVAVNRNANLPKSG